MGEKLISKNDLTVARISFFWGFRSKIGKNKEMILGKFGMGQDLEHEDEHGQIDNWNFNAKALLIRAKIKLRQFQNYLHLYAILLDTPTHWGHNFKIFCEKQKVCCYVIELIDQIFVMPSIFVLNTNNWRT